MNGKTRYNVSKMGPRSVDIYVGKRLRTCRTLSGISQEHLADKVGLTFQQIQKYENGMNRISASRLYEFSSILDVTPGWFFEGYEETSEGNGSPQFHKRETLELVRNYDACSLENKKAVRNFVKSVTAEKSSQE